MYFLHRYKWLGALAALFLLVGCAKTNVRETHEIARTNLPRPTQVLIYDFAVSPADIQQNSSIFAQLGRNLGSGNPTEEEIQLGREVADALSTELMTKIADLGLNPVRAAQNMPVAAGSIVITGRFHKIDEGNRLRRNVIGLGMGQSSIDSEVHVLAPGPSGYAELIGFDAHADSGSMPGAAVMGPAGAAAGAGTAAIVATNAATGALKSYKSAAAQQAKALADKIGEQLSGYFAQQGWISPGAGQ